MANNANTSTDKISIATAASLEAMRTSIAELANQVLQQQLEILDLKKNNKSTQPPAVEPGKNPSGKALAKTNLLVHPNLAQMKFIHARWVDEVMVAGKEVVTAVRPRGGYTFAVRDNLDGTLTFAVSRCSDKDVFCKRTGRDVAMDRLSSPRYAKTIKSTFNAFRADVSLALDFFENG